MAKKKYEIVDQAEVPKRTTGQYTGLWQTVKNLPAGKALKYQCQDQKEMRRVIVSIQQYHGKRENIPISATRDTPNLIVYFAKK